MGSVKGVDSLHKAPFEANIQKNTQNRFFLSIKKKLIHE